MSLPTAFISHGAPTYALDPGHAAQTLHAWGQSLPQPKAVLVVSAHWITREPRVAVTARPPTIHDFGGFPAELYRLQYPAPGAPDLAQQANQLLQAAGWSAQADADWGFDHGAWVPLMHLFPTAAVPVFQVSIPQSLTPSSALAYGKALAPLRQQGVLIVGSGSLTHNLRDIQTPGAPTLPYVQRYLAHAKAAVERNDRAAIAALPTAAPDPATARQAHPSLDHILPLNVALGASAGQAMQWLEGGVRFGALSMDSIVFG